MRKYFIALIVLLLSLIVVGGIYVNIDKKTGEQNSLLSKDAYTNSKYGVKMYPPDGWYSTQDDYFNAQIMFLDKPRSSISDFASSNSIITLLVYPNDDSSYSSEKYIDEIKKSIEEIIQAYKSVGGSESSDDKLLKLNYKYSILNEAITNKESVVIDGIDGIAYNFGWYFGGSGLGRTILLEKDKKFFVIIAEVNNEDTWIKDKEKIIQSMMSFKLIK